MTKLKSAREVHVLRWFTLRTGLLELTWTFVQLVFDGRSGAANPPAKDIAPYLFMNAPDMVHARRAAADQPS